MDRMRGIQNLPIALFSSVMGLASLTIAYFRIETMIKLNHYISISLTVFVIIIFTLQAFVLFYRYVKYKDTIKDDFNHPVKMNFYGTISISLFLLATLLFEWNESLSFFVWAFGALLQVVLTLYLLNELFWKKEFTIEQFNPTWFIPIVGNIVAPLSGALHVDSIINWFFFSIGIIFTIIYLTIFIYKAIFIGLVPKPLIPTLFIIIAPLSVGVTAYSNIVGNLTSFTYILYGLATYILFLYLIKWSYFFTIPFTISWWAYLFPTAAYLNATILLYEEHHYAYLRVWLIILIILVTILSVYLIIQTSRLLIKGKLFNIQK